MFATPDNRMANKRKSMLNSSILESPSGMFNTIRRQSVITSTPAVPQVNDDEAERKNLKRMSTIQDSEHRASPSMPVKSLEEFLGTWVRMSAENKINAKNVWKIHIIDYLNTLLSKNIENPLQIASASLGASAKVYSLRVDDVYSEVLKLAGELGRRGAGDRESHTDDEGNNHDDGGAAEAGEGNDSVENRKKQKKTKRKKKKTLVNPETLTGEPDLLDINHPLFAELNTRKGDINGSNNMLQVFVPINNKTSEYDLSCNDPFFDPTPAPVRRPNAMDVDVPKIKLHSELPHTDALKPLQICPEFRNFSFLNWSPEADLEQSNVNHTLNKTPTAEEINLAFDIDAEPLPIMDTSQNMENGNQPLSSDDEMVQEEINVHPNANTNGISLHVENIVDMRPSNLNTTRNLEYSYNSIANGIWAGPAHWKIKSIVHRPTLRISSHPGQPTPGAQTIKRKRNTTRNTNHDITYDNVNTSTKTYSKCTESKLKLATISNWGANSNKNILPVDLHIQVTDRMRLFLNKKIKIVPMERPPSNISIEDNKYDYNNLNDSAFCNAPDPGLMDEPHSDNEDIGCNNEEIFNEPEHDEVFTGDGLIAAPVMVPKTFIPYATRAKKVDMKKIKSTMWNIITRGKHDQTEDKENTDVNSDHILEKDSIEIKFSELYKELPQALPPDQASNLSLALTFFALLHLTNENSLELTGRQDRSDILIKKG